MRDASLDDFFSSSDEESEADEPSSESGTEAETEVESEPEPEAETEAETESDSDSERESDADPDAETAGPPPVVEVEPARSTFAWSPDGATCAACGERVEERWESEVGMVCVECKHW